MKKKKTAKKQKTSLLRLENEFKTLAAKLARECRKKLDLLKQQTKNLNSELKQIEKLEQLAHTKSTQLSLRKKLLNASEKKQWKAANKLKQMLGKRITHLTTTLPAFEQEMKNLEWKHENYMHLNKKMVKKESKTNEVAPYPTPEPLLQPPMFPNFSNFF